MTWCRPIAACFVFVSLLMTTEKVTAQSPAPSPAKSDIAAMLEDAMDSPVTLGKIKTKISGLGKKLSEKLGGVPVFVDSRALEIAEFSSDTMIKTNLPEMPFRSALRTLLEPMSLRGVIEEEGLVITADFAALGKRGIATNRWLNGSYEFANRIDKTLDTPYSVNYVDVPLQDVAAELSEKASLPIGIDTRALEEIGLSSDQPVSLSLRDTTLRSILNLMLGALDLTYTNKNDVLMITTIEAAEQDLVNRIYWLEGTGFPAGEFQSLIDSIQTTIVPDTWEALGGPSTMAPITAGHGNRPALVISTIYPIHHEIEVLLDTLRSAQLGPDPLLSSMPKAPARILPNSSKPPGGGGSF